MQATNTELSSGLRDRSRRSGDQNPWYKNSIFERKKNHAKPEAPLKNYLLKYLLPRYQHAHLCSLCVRLFSLSRARALSLSRSYSRDQSVSPTAHTDFSDKAVTDRWLHEYI